MIFSEFFYYFFIEEEQGKRKEMERNKRRGEEWQGIGKNEKVLENYPRIFIF